MTEEILAGGKRARSDAQKALREATILAEARSAIAENGYDGITMNALARRSGVAKGTLYLYFRTKEEVFLRLYTDALRDWIAEACAARAPDAEALIAVLTRAARRDALFLPLSARLSAVIERNVSDAALYVSKRAMARHAGPLAGELARVLALPAEAALDLIRPVFVVLQGAAQLEAACGQDDARHPEDIREMLAGSAFEKNFPMTLRLVLTGARPGTGA